MTLAKLKACPFCGCSDQEAMREYVDWVGCPECQFTLRPTRWNTRPIESSLRAALASAERENARLREANAKLRERQEPETVAVVGCKHERTYDNGSEAQTCLDCHATRTTDALMPTQHGRWIGGGWQYRAALTPAPGAKEKDA